MLLKYPVNYDFDQVRHIYFSYAIIPDFPCHSQATERFVHVVSQSSLSVVDKNRPAHIAAKIMSRRTYPNLDSRKNLL